jgi:hypothetical protein
MQHEQPGTAVRTFDLVASYVRLSLTLRLRVVYRSLGAMQPAILFARFHVLMLRVGYLARCCWLDRLISKPVPRAATASDCAMITLSLDDLHAWPPGR